MFFLFVVPDTFLASTTAMYINGAFTVQVTVYYFLAQVAIAIVFWVQARRFIKLVVTSMRKGSEAAAGADADATAVHAAAEQKNGSAVEHMAKWLQVCAVCLAVQVFILPMIPLGVHFHPVGNALFGLIISFSRLGASFSKARVSLLLVGWRESAHEHTYTTVVPCFYHAATRTIHSKKIVVLMRVLLA